METPSSKGLDGLANVVANKWFAVMGFVGMMLFVATLVVDLPFDRYAAGCIGLIMMGYGFGQTECRTFRTQIGHGYKITGPAWRMTVSGFLLFTIAIGASIALAIHVWPT